MIIDCNAHPTPTGKWFNSDKNASLDLLLKKLDENKISKAILIPFEGIISNEFILDLTNKYPDRFIPAISVNPNKYINAEDAFYKFTEDYKNINAPILKLHNRIHGFDVLDERVIAILKANEKRAKPFIIFICGLITNKNVHLTISPPVVFQKIITKFENTTFVIMHCGLSWALNIYDTIKDCRNAYMDLSYVITKYRSSSLWNDLNFLCENFDQRLIYGSDFPEIDITESIQNFNLLTHNIEQSKIENISYKNISKLLDL